METQIMKWSWKIARIAGIDIYIHTTFLLLVGFVALSYWLTQGSIAVMLEGVLFLLAIFLCVVLHELGHALTARRFGIQTKDILLMPLGGVARLERMPEKPLQELWVALAGPLVNVAITIILFVGLTVTNTMVPLTSLTVTDGNFFERLLAVNISLVLFNLLPAFPMDGGRVVRALLATRLEYTRATHIAATLGQGMAFILGFIGLFSNPMLVFIAFFVWIGAAQEASMVQVKSALSGIPVSRAMLTDFQSLAPTDPLARPVQLILSGSQHDFPVVSGSSVVGILTRSDVIRALAEHNENIFVSFIMRKDFQVIDSNQMLESVSQNLQANQQGILPVVNNGGLVGLLTMENIGEFMMIQSAIRARKVSQANL
jgi:Zn-dependent protease/CBS domain-containing protein